jgi:hypothetical protein
MKYSKVSIMRAVDMARRKLEMQQMGNHLSDFIEWAWEGEFKIGSSLTFDRKECNVQIENGVGCLPSDVIYINGLAYGGYNIEASTADFQKFKSGVMVQGGMGIQSAISHPDAALNHFYGFSAGTPLKFSISNGKIRMMSISNGLVAISYMGICVDEQGYPLINELHVDAVSQYIVYMQTERDYLRQRTPAHVYDRMKRRWIELCAQASAEDDMPDSLELRILAGIWNNMLPMPSLNNF